MSFLVENIYHFHNSRVEQTVIAADRLFADFHLWSDNICISELCIFDLCFWLNGIAIANFSILDKGSYAKHIVASNSHYIVFLAARFEHYYCFFLNYVVISEHYFYVLVLLFANNGAGWIDYAPGSKNYVADHIIAAQVYKFFVIHLLYDLWWLILNQSKE